MSLAIGRLLMERGLSTPMTTVNSLRLNGLNRGKLALYVWFCARGTRMQQTALPGSDAARGTRDG